jgi:hypothetical protein
MNVSTRAKEANYQKVIKRSDDAVVYHSFISSPNQSNVSENMIEKELTWLHHDDHYT